MCGQRISALGKTKAQYKTEIAASRTFICLQCNKEYVNKRRHKNEGNKYCSRTCSDAARDNAKALLPRSLVYFPVCQVCNQTFTSRRLRKCCSIDCGREHAKRRNYDSNKAKKPLNSRACKCCATVFIPEYGCHRRDYCSSACLKKHSRMIGKAVRRARIKGGIAESVDPYKVFDRDGWRCQICGKDTPRKHRGTCKANAPELDHRTPLSKGGNHTYMNTQCACRECNQDKGCKTEAGQYPLFNHNDTHAPQNVWG